MTPDQHPAADVPELPEEPDQPDLAVADDATHATVDAIDARAETADATVDATTTQPDNADTEAVVDTAVDQPAADVSSDTDTVEPDAAREGQGGGQEQDAARPYGVADLASALEAVLMVVDEPIPAVQLAQVLEAPRVEVEQTLHRLAAEYTEAGRGFDLRAVAGGWRFYSRPECAPVVERFILDGQQARLTHAALETLAVIAYRQPVSRARVSAIRGVNCDGVVRTLVNRGLIEDAGTEQESNAVLYRTTTYFLERLGLQHLGELPDIAPYLPEVDELDDTEDLAG